MQDQRKTKDQLIDEVISLRERVAQLVAERVQPHTRAAAPYSEFDLSTLPENTADRVWVVDRQYRLLWGNSPFRDNMRAAFGREFAPGDYVLIDEFPAETRAVWRSHYDRALRGEKFGVELAAEFAPQLRIIDYQFNPISANDQVVGVVVAGRDITERKQAEAALRASETLYSTLVNSSPDGITVTDLDQHILYASPRLLAIHGLSSLDEIRGHTPLELVAPEDRVRLVTHVENLLRGDAIAERQYRLLRHDGSHFNGELQIAILRDAHGQPTGVMAITRDVSERLRLEDELRASEEKFRSIIEQASEGIFLIDEQARVIEYNHGLEQILGMPRTEALGLTAWEMLLHFVPDETRKPALAEQVKAMALSALTTGEGDTLDHPFVIQVLRPDGSTRWVRQILFPIKTAHGHRIAGIFLDITDRWQAEEALRLSEQRYRTLIENQGEGVGLVDANENFIFANPAAEDLFGLPGELPGHNLSEFVDPDQYALITRETLVRQQGQKSTYELAIRRPDRQIRNLLITAMPHVDEQGAFIGAFGVFRDITARKQAEDEIRRLNLELEQRVAERTRQLTEANAQLQADIHQRQRIEEMLHRSEQRYRTLFENAGDAIFIVDLSGQIIEVNHMASQQLGYTRDELKGMLLSTFDASPEVASVDERINRLRQAGEQAFEAVHRRRDGGLVPVEIKSRIVEYAGSPAILGIVRDVTERKRTEQALRQYADEQTALYTSALQLNSQLSTQDVMNSILEQAMKLVTAKTAAVSLHEPDRDVLVLTMVRDRDRGPLQDMIGLERRPGEGAVGQAFQQRRSLVINDYQAWEGRGPVSRTMGQFVQALVAVPLIGRHALLGILSMIGDELKPRFDEHDVRLIELFAAQATIALENALLYEQQQEHYRYLQDSQARLIQAEKMSALGRLVASIAHEINNPLQAVQGCLTLVRESVEERHQFDPAQAAEVMQDLDVAATEVTRVAGIVQRLRDFYRPTRAGTQLAEVNAVIEAVLALTAKQLQHSRIELDRALAARPLPVMTNADQIKQVCLNLILNAIDAMPQGGRLRVATQLTGAPGGTPAPDDSPVRPLVRIDFTDTGNGISPEDLPKIFEPFFTTKETGSGLGLSISYEIVKALGGEITVTSEPQRGSTFTIWLPVNANTTETLSEVSA